MRHQMRHQMNGFTLIELLITMAVVAIVLGIAIPNFNSLIRNNTSTAMAADFTGSLGLARTEAVKRAARISICGSKTGTACDGEWKEGYIIFVDDALTDTAASPVVGTVLKYWQPPQGVVQFDVAFGATSTNFFRYIASGALARISADQLTASIKLTGCSGQNARKIIINLSGQSGSQPEGC